MRYYNPLGKSFRFKRHRLFYKLVNALLKPFVGRSEVVWLSPKPLEPAVFIANHMHTYAPLALQFNLGLPVRPWANAYMLTYRNCIKLFYKKIAYDFKPRFLLFIILVFAAPIINLYFRSFSPIPVYHDARLRTTLKKNTETLSEGINVIIYPEKNIISPHKYVNELEPGFIHLRDHYRSHTGKEVLFYPVYCCKKPKKILIGEPLRLNTALSAREQREWAAIELSRRMNELAATLPEHKAYLNKAYPPDIKFNF